MRRDVATPPEHVDHVYVTGNVGHCAIHPLPENLSDIGIVDGNRDDRVSGCLGILGDVVGCLVAVDLDADNGNTLRGIDHMTDARVVVDEVLAPVAVAGRRRHDSYLCEDRARAQVTPRLTSCKFCQA